MKIKICPAVAESIVSWKMNSNLTPVGRTSEKIPPRLLRLIVCKGVKTMRCGLGSFQIRVSVRLNWCFANWFAYFRAFSVGQNSLNFPYSYANRVAKIDLLSIFSSIFVKTVIKFKLRRKAIKTSGILNFLLSVLNQQHRIELQCSSNSKWGRCKKSCQLTNTHQPGSRWSISTEQCERLQRLIIPNQTLQKNCSASR